MVTVDAMHAITAQEWELIAFFEAEPEKLDPNGGWPFNDFTFRTCRGDLHITFAVMPSYRDFTLKIEREGVALINLSALSVADIRYRDENGDEMLEIRLTDNDVIEFRLRPVLGLTGSLRCTEG